MEKGLDIAFQLASDSEGSDLVTALADLTGNFFAKHLDLQWRVFHVTLGDQKFFRILFTGKVTGKLHPGVHREIREKFDELSRSSYEQVMNQYETERKEPGFRVSKIIETKEEYDLWQDKFWQFF